MGKKKKARSKGSNRLAVGSNRVAMNPILRKVIERIADKET